MDTEREIGSVFTTAKHSERALRLPDAPVQTSGDFSERRRLIREIDSFLREHLDGLRNVYLAGSFARNEETLMEGCESLLSDIDVFVDLRGVSFLRSKLLGKQEKALILLQDILSKKGFRTHVSISLMSLTLNSRMGFVSAPNKIYLYEMCPISSLNGEPSSIDHVLPFLPDRRDAFDLACSAMADFLFVHFSANSNMTCEEKVYILAKRCLTILFVLLIFRKLYGKSYRDRIKIAIDSFDRLDDVLTAKDVDVLARLTSYKVSGDTAHLDSIWKPKERSILSLLESYFKGLSYRVLASELNRTHQDTNPNGRLSRPIVDALTDVYAKSVTLSPSTCLDTTFQILKALRSGNTEVARFVSYSLLFRKMRPRDLLRLIVATTFLNLDKNGESNADLVTESILPLWKSLMI